MSPEWARGYPAEQASALKDYREKARLEFTEYAPPSDSKLRTLVDSLAAEAAAKASGRVYASDSVWTLRELAAVALGLLITRASIEIDEQGERGQLPYSTTYAIQTLIPHRTQATIQWAIFRRYDSILEIYRTLMGDIAINGLEFFQEEIGEEGVALLRAEGVEEDAVHVASVLDELDDSGDDSEDNAEVDMEEGVSSKHHATCVQ